MTPIVFRTVLRIVVPLGLSAGSIVACSATDTQARAAEESSLAGEAVEGPPQPAFPGEPPPPDDPPPPGGPSSEQPPKRPPLCKTNADCEGACPTGSKGCTCHALPDGNSVCVPSCASDADCPTPPGAPPLKCHEGICAPPPPPPKPAACETESDCSDACPPGAKACTCRPAPKAEKICMPVCSADADCPKLPGGPPLACHDGVCAPPPPPKPPTR